MPRPDLLAAVDLGSNSFHLQVGRVVGGQIYPLDTLREVVRLGGGLTSEKRIDRATQARALEALQRIGERLRGLPRNAVRAVGTNTLRVAKNAPQFLREARAALGFPIEVIAGREEARLIYLGVAHSIAPSAHGPGNRRLVVDIGGGSTEFIIGKGLEPLLTESLYMGCVSYSLAYFPDGRVEKPRMKRAELAARQELAGMVREYRDLGWEEAVGSSGTARALETILRENGFAEDGITREGLDRLRSLLIKHERADPDRVAGLRKDRAPVLPGGLAIVLAHRGKLGKMQDAGLEGGDWTLVFALRIAALVLRNRIDARFPMLRVEGDKSGYSIDLPQAWLEENPLAAAALETEGKHWEAVDLRFTVNSLSEKKVAQLRG